MALLEFLKSFFGRREAPARRLDDDDDAALERYFTNAEEARSLFDALLLATTLPKRLMVIHGVGAVGKTSLLKMLRMRSRGAGVAVCLVAADDAPSVAELLRAWSSDLKETGLQLSRFDQIFTRYRNVDRKVRLEGTQAGLGTAEATAVDALATAAGKGAIKLAAGMVPGGAVLEVVGEEAAGAALNLLRAKLNRTEYELFLDPVGPLTDSFVLDMVDATRSTRAVVMLDTFEALSGLSDWMRSLVRRLPENVLVVIAGRTVPDWNADWPAWLGQAELVELHEMTDDDIGRLVERYHAALGRGEPDAGRVREVVAFARGLPLAATTAVELLAVSGRSEFVPSQAVVEDLGEQLLKDVPSEMRPAVEAAAVLRTFNVDSLGALLSEGDVSAFYRELRRWPFTRSRAEGLAVHDTMREVINEALRARSPAEVRALNEKAADHYAGLLERERDEPGERLQLEVLYHRVRAEEGAGMAQWCAAAEELVRYQLIARLRTLLNDAATYGLRREASRLWCRYYGARLDQLEGRIASAEAAYRGIGAANEADPKVRAYALCDLGSLLVEMDRLARPEGELRAREAIEQSIHLAPVPDSKLIMNSMSQMHLSNVRGAWDESLEHVSAMQQFAAAANDAFGLVLTNRLRAGILGLRGDWPGSLAARQAYMAALEHLGEVPALRMHASYLTWPLMFMGRLREAQRSVEDAIALADRLDEKELRVAMVEGLALSLGLQERYAESAERFTQAFNFHDNYYAKRQATDGGDSDRYIRATLSFRALVSLREGNFASAAADLDRALRIKESIGDRMGLPEVHVWLGQRAELEGSVKEAEAPYRAALGDRSLGRHYFECWALTGLARIFAVQGRQADCADAISRARDLATRYDYNDHLASLLLTQSQLAWDGRIDGRKRAGPASAQRHARAALIHALRFNRFLLDEVLVGRPEGSVFRPIIPDWLARGPSGRRALEGLATWWRTGVNELEDEPAAAVSPIAVGLALVEAERVSRQNEPGSGAPQRSVLDHIEAALAE